MDELQLELEKLTNETTNESTKQDSTPHLFTQEEVDAMIKAALAQSKKESKKEVKKSKPNMVSPLRDVSEVVVDDFVQRMKNEINNGNYKEYIYSSADAKVYGGRYEMIINGFVLQFALGKATKVPLPLYEEVYKRFTSPRILGKGFSNYDSNGASYQDMEEYMNSKVMNSYMVKN